jgi:hypothetical protein
METMKKPANRGLLVSKGWIQAVAIVVVFGFFILGLLAYRTYRDEPPIPARTVGETGEILFTYQDVVDGQGVFLRNGLMEYGSIFGHGAYLGPDFTADYLHRAALLAIDAYGGSSLSSWNFSGPAFPSRGDSCAGNDTANDRERFGSTAYHNGAGGRSGDTVRIRKWRLAPQLEG